MPALGCGDYQVNVVARGGRSLLAEFPWETLSWGRVLDDTSQAEVLTNACSRALAAVRPWRHELAVLRDGVLVWSGPIVDITCPPPNGMRLVARDMTAWWDHRRIHTDHRYEDGTDDLCTIFVALHDDAMGPDNSARVELVATASGVKGRHTVLGVQHELAGKQLRDIANTGIDFVALGRTIYAGGAVSHANIGIVTQEHMRVPAELHIDGASQANNWLVRGAGGGAAGDTIYGEAGDTVAGARDGLLEAVDSVTTITSNDEALVAAKSRLALYADPPIVVDRAQLTRSAPFALSSLVPGRLVTMDLQDTQLGDVRGSYRIKSVEVSSSARDETVTVVFQPPGSSEGTAPL